jgi:hypothetical protein
MREGLPKTESSLSSASKTEQYLDSSKKLITQLTGFYSQSFEKVDEELKTHETEIDNISKNIEGSKDYKESKDDVMRTKRMVKEIEDKIDASLYVIHDNLKKAGMFARECEAGPEKLKEDLLKIKRITSSYDMGKKVTRDKVKGFGEKIAAIELKLAIISKQRGEEPSSPEEKFVKVSVISNDITSTLENQ